MRLFGFLEDVEDGFVVGGCEGRAEFGLELLGVDLFGVGLVELPGEDLQGAGLVEGMPAWDAGVGFCLFFVLSTNDGGVGAGGGFPDDGVESGGLVAGAGFGFGIGGFFFLIGLELGEEVGLLVGCSRSLEWSRELRGRDFAVDRCSFCLSRGPLLL